MARGSLSLSSDNTIILHQIVLGLYIWKPLSIILSEKRNLLSIIVNVGITFVLAKMTKQH